MENQIDIRSYLFEIFCNQYQVLVKIVNNTPIDPNVKNLVMYSFGTGFLFMKEQFELMNISTIDTKEISDSANTEDKKVEDNNEQNVA